MSMKRKMLIFWISCLLSEASLRRHAPRRIVENLTCRLRRSEKTAALPASLRLPASGLSSHFQSVALASALLDLSHGFKHDRKS